MCTGFSQCDVCGRTSVRKHEHHFIMQTCRKCLLLLGCSGLLLVFMSSVYFTETDTRVKNKQPLIQGWNRHISYINFSTPRSTPTVRNTVKQDIRLAFLSKRKLRSKNKDGGYAHSADERYKLKFDRAMRLYEKLLRNENSSVLNEGQLHVHIATTWRTGSSFLGELIQSFPGVFYTFEPLQFISFSKHLEPGQDADRGVSMLRSLYSCNYSSPLAAQYLKHIEKRKFAQLLEKNWRLWKVCRGFTPICYDPRFLESVCSSSPIILAKTVRLRVAAAQRLLDEQNLRHRLVVLFRDPRGVINSRRTHDWCRESNSCFDTDVVCADLREDLESARRLVKEYPEQVLLLRYEDLAMEPEEVTVRLLNFLGLPFLQSVKEFLNTHTHAQPLIRQNGPKDFQTVRDSKKTPYMWREKLALFPVTRIQNACRSSLEDLGYLEFSNWNDLKNLNIPVLRDKELPHGFIQLKSQVTAA